MPLLVPRDLPAADDDWVGFVEQLISAHVSTARAMSDELKDGTVRSASEVLARWNDATIALTDAMALSQLLSEVHPEVGVRTRSEVAAQELAKFATESALDAQLYAVFAALDPSGLDPVAARLLRHIVRDFRRAGVDQDAETRGRLAAISERLTVLGQDFSRTIRDDVRSIRIAPERLAGLPEDFIDAHPADDNGLVTVTTDYPDSIPFRTFAHDRAARHELMAAFLNRGWPDNDPLLREILDLRHEQATLLGYADWPTYDAEVKMIGSAAAIEEFIDRIAAHAQGPGTRDLQVLLERAQRDDPAIEELSAGDSAYYAELVRRERFEVDAQEVRRYFAFPKVRDGLLAVTGRLFGVSYEARPDVPTWHGEVTAYDVVRDGVVIGRIYLDLHPREGKYKHAAQFTLVSGVRGRQLPEGALVCNFPTGKMEHTEVITLFHEFGHLVHHILGGQDQEWVRYSGVATEWDFVEAPSQLLEEWAWDAEVLRSFATDDAGSAIPAELVAKMVTAHEFGMALQARTQMFYAATSYYLHRDRPADHTALVARLQQRYDLLARIPDTHFQAAFGHLDSYGSGYYTYMWSLVIAKDMFGAFDEADLFDPIVAGRYRDCVLAPGGSADAADLVADFLGRPTSFDTFGAWLAR